MSGAGGLQVKLDGIEVRVVDEEIVSHAFLHLLLTIWNSYSLRCMKHKYYIMFHVPIFNGNFYNLTSVQGRGVFATRDFKKGETVVKDYPIVTCQFAWNQLYSYKACEYCLRYVIRRL